MPADVGSAAAAAAAALSDADAAKLAPRGAAAAALRTAPRPVYTRRDAALDGLATLAAAAGACVALKALQDAVRG